MALPLPTGVYYVYFQPDKTQFYLTLDQSSLPTVDILSPGSKSQQWQVTEGLADANARALRNVQFETYIGRSALASQNDTLAVATPIPWYITSSSFGAGWWRISANPNDAGPWWVIEVNGSGFPLVRLSSAGWMIFFFLDASVVNDPSSSPTSSSSAPLSSSMSSSGGLSSGDVAALASSIPIGVLGLILAAIGVWYARKQLRAGKPVLGALKDDMARFRYRG